MACEGQIMKALYSILNICAEKKKEPGISRFTRGHWYTKLSWILVCDSEKAINRHETVPLEVVSVWSCRLTSTRTPFIGLMTVLSLYWEYNNGVDGLYIETRPYTKSDHSWNCQYSIALNMKRQYSQPSMRCYHCMPSGSLRVLGVFESLSEIHLIWIAIKWSVLETYHTHLFGWNPEICFSCIYNLGFLTFSLHVYCRFDIT